MKHIKSIGLVFVLILSCNFIANAQFNKSNKTSTEKKSESTTNDEDEFKKGFDKRKIIYGGGLGLSFGNYTNININPIVGYRFTKIVGVGISGSYNYYSHKYIDINTQLKVKDAALTYGGGLWAKAFVLEQVFKSSPLLSNIFFTGAYEQNKIKYTQTVPNSTLDYTSKWYPSLLVGIGLRQKISDRAAMNILIQHDVLEQSPLYINTPLITNFGISFGL
jgi:hypothetical protein